MQAQGRRYQILSVLGSGGFGTVYRAEQISEMGLRREVALKVLHAGGPAQEEAARRLRDEARMLSNVAHAGIVRVEDLMVLDGRWTMVMELVPGVDVERLLAEREQLPAGVALAILEAASRSLWAVNQAPGPDGRPLALIHRDVKPANLLVTADGDLKLLDFGVARAELAEREADTQQAFVMGSLPYMAPERYSFMDLHAGDVYGLGCCLYEMLLGERFGRTRPKLEAHNAQLRRALHRAWELLDASIREPVLELLGECLAYEPKSRPSAEQVANRAQSLRRQAPGPALHQWAREVVPGALALRDEVAPDALCGRVLVEGASVASQGEQAGGPLGEGEAVASETTTVLPLAFPPPPPAPPVEPLPRPEPVTPSTPEPATQLPPLVAVMPERAPRAPSKAPLFVAVGALMVVFASLIAGLLVLATRATQPGPAPQVQAAQVQPLQQPPVDTGGILFQDVDPSELAPPSERLGPTIQRPPRRPRVKPQPQPEVVEVAPALDPSEAPGQGRVLVFGDMESLRVVGSSGTFSAGSLPAGQYTLFPSFPGGYTIKGPTLTLAEGQTLRFQCKAQSMSCERI